MTVCLSNYSQYLSGALSELNSDISALSSAESLVDVLGDAVPQLMHDLSNITTNDYLTFNDNYKKSCEARQALKDIHFICNSMYKNNDISKDTYVKFIGKFHGKSTTQMLADY